MKTMDGWPEDYGKQRPDRPGRPEEDHFARKMEIYQAVSPMVREVGARELSMQQAAEAAHLSVGGLYYYFSSKRELLLFPVLPGNCIEFFRRFEDAHAELKERNPRAYLDKFIEAQVDSVWTIRPAIKAAMQLGAEDLQEIVCDADIQAEIAMFLSAVRRAMGTRHDPELLSQAIMRQTAGAVMDSTITRDGALADLRTLIYGEPLRRATLREITGAAESAGD